MKNCVHCGFTLPDTAEFCPNCAAGQSERTEIRPPRSRRRKKTALILLIAVAAVAALAALLLRLPKTYAGGSSLIYSAGGEQYLLMLSYNRDGTQRMPTEEAKVFLSVGERAQKPTQFFVYPADGSDRDVSESFLSLVRGVEVRCEELNRNKCPVDEAHWDEDFPLATRIAYLRPDWLVGDNDVIWTFRMKNGDTIELRHRLNVEVTKTVEYREGAYDMSTPAALQALLDKAVAESGDFDQLIFYLPGVTYTASVTMRDRHIRLMSADGENWAVFTAPVYYSTTLATNCELWDIDFLGSGSDTAVNGEGYVELHRCTVRNWETGVLAHRNAAAQDSLFQENGTAFLMDTEHFTYSEGEMFRNTFRDNGVAVHLVQLPTEYGFQFDGCVFSGNGEDIINETAHETDVSKAVFDPD